MKITKLTQSIVMPVIIINSCYSMESITKTNPYDNSQINYHNTNDYSKTINNTKEAMPLDKKLLQEIKEYNSNISAYTNKIYSICKLDINDIDNQFIKKDKSMIKKMLDDFIKYAYADTELRSNVINLHNTHEKLNNDKSQKYFKNKKLYEYLYYNNIQIKDIIYKMSTIFINKDKVYNNKKLLIKRLHEISDELEQLKTPLTKLENSNQMKALQNQILENVKTILEFACESKSLAKSDKNIEEFFEFLYNSILGDEQMLKILTNLTSTNHRTYNKALKNYKLHFQNGPYSFLCDEKCMDIYTNILIAIAQDQLEINKLREPILKKIDQNRIDMLSKHLQEILDYLLKYT